MKETISLKQMTPMWHFQSEIPGCCLRATEVKPKLDRYILQNCKDDERIHLIGNTKSSDIKKIQALDYKLSFDVGNNTDLKLEGKNYKLFFANVGDGPKKGIVFYQNLIKMTIFSLHGDLIELIKENICDFFATISFGTRQDKGFGYFYPADKNFIETYGDNAGFEVAHGAQYKITFQLSGNKSYVFEETFKHINYFHKIIRSGINELGIKYKSFMERYAETRKEHYIWDKSLIRFNMQSELIKIKENEKNKANGKKKKISEDIQKDIERCKAYSKEILLFRDMLGLASEQEWKSYNATISIKSTDREFVRFKSPINYRPSIKKIIVKDENNQKFYKVYEVTVFIHFEDSGLKTFTSKEFNIKGKINKKISCDLGHAYVYGDFSLSDYFEFILACYKKCYKNKQFINGTNALNEEQNNDNEGDKTGKKCTTKKANYYINNLFNPTSEEPSFNKVKNNE